MTKPDVHEIAEQLRAMPIEDLIAHADVQLCLLVLAKLVLEQRDPEAYAAWWASIECDVLETMAEFD
jgi:hypothetical protein